MKFHAMLRSKMEGAIKYPIELRIAAYFIVNGGTEEEFNRIRETELNLLPMPIVLRVQNYIRDIERGRYELREIPLAS